MKHLLAVIACVTLGLAHAEDITLVAENIVSEEGLSQPITLGQGESAKLVYAMPSSFYPQLVCETAGKTFTLPCYRSVNNLTVFDPITIAGPATVRLRSGGFGSGAGSGFVTLSVTRIGIASPPASIPQEAGAKFDVILESSSDLVNWLAVNPGEYTGTETNRFFRTRIVRKDQP